MTLLRVLKVGLLRSLKSKTFKGIVTNFGSETFKSLKSETFKESQK